MNKIITFSILFLFFTLNLCYSQVFNVKDVIYGAVGDGINDDTESIKAAIAAAKDYGQPCEIYFPEGVYRISEMLQINFDNVQIKGHSSTTSKILASDSHSTYIALLVQKVPATSNTVEYRDIVNNNPIQNITIQNLEFELEYRGPNDAGVIQINNCIGFYVENVHVKGDGFGMGGAPKQTELLFHIHKVQEK